MDWETVQSLVRLVQTKQAISKDTLASSKKSLKSPSKSLVCSTLTTLDSVAANCGPTVRAQLAEPRWVEMLLSVCFKNPTAALPICQLFSNWACSYQREQLGHASNFAIQSLKQKGAIIPPPAPLAHHMVCLHTLYTSVIISNSTKFQQRNDEDAPTCTWLQAEAVQQGTPMLGFQRGFDFTSVDLWSSATDQPGENLDRGSMHCLLAVWLMAAITP